MSDIKMDQPSTPLHPNADSEVNLKAIDSEAPQDFALDLNSDLSDDEELVFENVQVESRDSVEPRNTDATNKTIQDLKNELSPTVHSPSSVTSLRELEQITEFATNEEFDDGGFTDIEQPRNTPINPFKEDNDNHKHNPATPTFNNFSSPSNTVASLSSAQQSRFCQYIDDRLLQIQRKFIKHISGDLDQQASHFTLDNLLDELSLVLDFLWYSLFETKTIPLVTKSTDKTADEPPIANPRRGFGQTSYLIKIMGDLTEYIYKYEFTQWHDITNLLLFLKKIDCFVSIIIDQTEQNNLRLIDRTEKVRIDSIITRTKMIVIEKFEHLRFELVKNSSAEDLPKKDDHSGSSGIVTKYEEKIGEIYEGIIDRISI